MSAIETFVEQWDAPITEVEDTVSGLKIVAQLHTSKIIPKKVLKRDFPTGFNREVRVFHIAPEVDTRSYMGRVEDLWWDDDTDEPFVKLDLNEDTHAAKEIRRIILEDMGKPLKDRRIKGVSAGIIGTYDKKSGEMVKFTIREVSLARNPVCEDCTIQEVITYEEKVMPEDMKRVVELFENLQNSAVDSMKKSIDSQSRTIGELEQKIQRYEQTIELQHERIEELTGLVDEQKTSIETFDQKLADERDKVEKVVCEPMIDKIMQFERIDPKTDDGKARLAELQEENSKSLTKMLKGYERILELSKRGMSGQSTAANIIETGGMGIANFDNENLSPTDRLKATRQALGAETREKGVINGSVNGAF